MAEATGPEEAILAYRKANIKAIQRVLERAQATAEKKARQGRTATFGGQGYLTKALEAAMASHGRNAAHRPSIRLRAPDTGGRPYHFGYTTVTKGSRQARRDAPAAQHGGSGPDAATDAGHSGRKAPEPGSSRKGSGAGNKRGKWGKTGGRTRDGQTREASHQQYTERANALQGGERSIETQEELGQDVRANPEIDRKAEPSPDDLQNTMSWIEEQERPGLSIGSSPSAAQAYIENVEKAAHVRGTTASFGTIGDTIEERMAFWDLVHEHESDAGGRTQNRLVLELPHEATAEARFQIVRRYAHEFERKGIPFWAAIHAPTKHNDSRNHHAHLVFTDRPMSKMTHPDTGELVWDFTIAEAYKTKSRNTKFKHPYRQNRDPEMRERGYIKSSRARFAQIVNDVMVEHGLGVRYDPRSYADMGLNVAPMANVSRILSDKAKTRSFVVLDAEWTRRMIDAEMQDAAARRTDTFQRLSRVEDDLKKATKGINGTRTPNRHLPRHLHVSTGHQMGGRLASALSAAMLRIERDHLASAFVDEATERTLTHILAATSLKKDRQGKAKVHNGDAGTGPGRDRGHQHGGPGGNAGVQAGGERAQEFVETLARGVVVHMAGRVPTGRGEAAFRARGGWPRQRSGSAKHLARTRYAGCRNRKCDRACAAIAAAARPNKRDKARTPRLFDRSVAQDRGGDGECAVSSFPA